MKKKIKSIKPRFNTKNLEILINKEKRNFIKKIILISQIMFVPISFNTFKKAYIKIVKNNDLNWILNHKDL